MFNAGTTIAESVQSALSSGTSLSCPPVSVEVIVCDDGSTDNSIAIVKSFAAADPRVRLLQSPNTGPSAARNRGINIARGRFLRFLDADDRATPQSSALLVAFAQPSGAACGTFELMDARGRPMGRFAQPFTAPDGTVSIAQLRNANGFGTGTTVIRRDLFADIRFDEFMRHCEDWHCWARLARRGLSWLALPRGVPPVKLYRVSLNTASHNHANMVAGAAHVIAQQHALDNTLPPSWAMRSQALCFASNRALSGDVDGALQLLRQFAPPDTHCSPETLADSTLWSVLSSLDQFPHERAQAGSWPSRAAAWWRRLLAAGQIAHHELDAALTHLGLNLVHPPAIAQELVSRAARLSASILLLGYDLNGRLLLNAAQHAGLRIELRDHALASDPAAAIACGVEPFLSRSASDPPGSDSIPIITSESTPDLLTQLPGAQALRDGFTWAQARSRLALANHDVLQRIRAECLA